MSSPSPVPSGAVAAIDGPVVSVSALSADRWWVLESTPAGHVTLLKTTDGGSTFTIVSRTGDTDGIPAGTSTVWFLGHGLGWALRADADPGDQIWQTVDGGTTWGRPGFSDPVLALANGDGKGWLLVQKGSRVGVALIEPAIFENPEPTVWLGTGNGVQPALTVQGGDAVVFWFTDSTSRLSVVAGTAKAEERTNPCTPDVGVGSVSATDGGLAVSCHSGMSDQPLGSTDGGRTWATFGQFGDSQAQRLAIASTGTASAAIGGQDGKIALSEIPEGSQPAKPRHTEVSGDPSGWTWLGFTDASHGFAIDDRGALFRTTDGGSTWSVVTGAAS
jgi:hypothetical protein